MATVALAVGPALAAFPGANGRLVFTREDDEIFTVALDGSGETNVSNHPADEDDPTWSADGTRIAFQSGRGGSPTLWVMDADGGNPTPVPGSIDGDDEPTWSPDGTRIAFKRGGADDEIWVVNLDGSGLANLTNFPQDDDEHPSWSPDGTRIAFHRDGNLWVMNADGSGQTSLSGVEPTDREDDEHPNWSPDGSRLVFDAELDGDREIFVMDADGTNVVQLTSNDAEDSHAAWSPDGTLIAFQSDRAPNGEDKVWVMDADGQNPRVVGDAAASDDDREPDWQPLALPTTTIATTTTSVTTTTLPYGTPAPGRKLVLKDRAGKPAKRALVLLAKDRGIGVGAENGGGGDPVLHGGFLKVVSATGDGFNHTYDLPADRWRYKGKAGRNKGYRLGGAGPIRSVSVKLGKTVKVVAKGDALGHSLGADPAPVHVALGLGAERYCFTFGGRTKFKAGRSYVATKASAPGACTALVPTCGDARLEGDESCPTLEGPDDGLAIDAVSDYQASIEIPATAVDVDASGRTLVRTRLELVFHDTTTVGTLEALLARIGARISSMLARVPSVVVDIPDPGSVAALEAQAADLEADPIVRMVLKAYEPVRGALPPGYTAPLDATAGPRIDHHLAVRAAAAWNARAAILTLSQPNVVVLDYFGDGPPDGALDAAVPAADFTSGSPDDHGYHVAGIIAASFGGAMPRGQATGMMPGRTPMRVVDIENPTSSYLDDLNRTADLLGTGNPNRILNTSLGYGCGTPLADVTNDGWWWTEKIRLRGLEGRVLHLTAAGNLAPACPAEVASNVDSRFTAAALLPLPVPNLTNVLVVENAMNDGGPAFAPRCLAPGSKTRGHLAGIGTAVWSLLGAKDASGAGDKTGTSMATPQVAGLASYLWSLDPAMSVQELKGLLLTTARPVPLSGGLPGCSALDPAPVIDAYAAVLAVDEAALPTPVGAPIRHAILDVDDDQDFDEADLATWRTKLIHPATGEIREPATPGFDRYDLNGDGYTGGAARRQPFDLDRVGSTQYGASQLGLVTQDVGGFMVEFDELALNDLDVLCYYAYSALYEGTGDGRRDHLGVRDCSGVDMTVDFPPGIVPGTPEALTVRLAREGSAGSAPMPDVYVTLAPLGGTAIPPDGTTDGQGEFQSQITLDPGWVFVEVVVQALTAPGGEVLAEKVVGSGQPYELFFDFSDGYQGWQGDTTQSSGWGTVVRLDRNDGTIKLDGVDDGGGDGDLEPNAWIYRTIVLPPTAVGLQMDVSAHDRNGADALYRVRLAEQNGAEHTLIDWTERSGIEGTLTFSTITTSIAAWAGQTVTLYLEQDGNAPGSHEQIYWDNVRIVTSTTTTSSTTTTTTSSSSSSSPPTTVLPTTTSPSTSTSTTTTTTSSTVPTTSAPTTVATTSSTTSTLVGFPVVPYRSYAGSGPDGPVVMLDDELASETVDLGAVTLDLAPVAIDGVLPLDPVTHQTCYAHPGAAIDTCVDIQHALGLAPVRVGTPEHVCVPELFPSIPVDAFKCHAASGAPLGLEVQLADDFQTQTVTVGAPALFCTPVSVDGSLLVSGVRYLVCYQTAPVGAVGGPIQVENALHASAIQVDVGAATGLCLPAVRQLVATCQLCGDGNLDGGEDCDDANLTDGDGCSAVCRFERDCTCDGVPVPPPNGERCAVVADCTATCSACTAGGGACGCN